MEIKRGVRVSLVHYCVRELMYFSFSVSQIQDMDYEGTEETAGVSCRYGVRET